MIDIEKLRKTLARAEVAYYRERQRMADPYIDRERFIAEYLTKKEHIWYRETKVE